MISNTCTMRVYFDKSDIPAICDDLHIEDVSYALGEMIRLSTLKGDSEVYSHITKMEIFFKHLLDTHL